MSIRPSTIDRHGERPCLPDNALLAVCERLAQRSPAHQRDAIDKTVDLLKREEQEVAQ